MFERADYHHPPMEPYGGDSWKEVAFSWVIGVVATAAVLLVL